MIGLSVSLCISRMARGDVDPETVEKIIAGTRAETPADWDDVIQSYRTSYWRNFPDRAEVLLRQFIAEGKVVQPRLANDRHYPVRLGEKIFVDSEDEIFWSDGPRED